MDLCNSQLSSLVFCVSVWSCLVTAFPPGPKEERGARRASWREPMSVGYCLFGDVSVTLEGAVAPLVVFLEISEDMHLIGRAACRRPVEEKTSSLRALGNHRFSTEIAAGTFGCGDHLSGRGNLINSRRREAGALSPGAAGQGESHREVAGVAVEKSFTLRV